MHPPPSPKIHQIIWICVILLWASQQSFVTYLTRTRFVFAFLHNVSYMSESFPWSSSAQCGPLGRSALHIWFMSHTFPIWWASQAFCFNCEAFSDWVQLICMFACLPACAIGNLFPLLSRRKLRQLVSGFIELPVGLVHYHAVLDVQTYLAGFPWLQLKNQ